MEYIVNEALIPMINEGMLSMSRINDLICIKEFIDRVSSRQYIETRTAEELCARYGVMPDIITWGDYFQTEMASSFVGVPDDEFRKAMYTVKFDVMSCHEIFPGKDREFLDWIDEWYYRIVAENSELLSEEDEEILHLKVMKDYFIDMGVTDKFTQAERQWYCNFNEAVAM
jgi:hypothetical protein